MYGKQVRMRMACIAPADAYRPQQQAAARDPERLLMVFPLGKMFDNASNRSGARCVSEAGHYHAPAGGEWHAMPEIVVREEQGLHRWFHHLFVWFCFFVCVL